MKKSSFLVFGILAVLALSACPGKVGDEKSGLAVYPRWHYVRMYKDEMEVAKNTPSYYLNWGDKLIINTKEPYALTNAGDKKGENILYFVKNTLDGSQGYVYKKNVVEKPVARAAIVNQVVVYQSPSVVSRNPKNAKPPLLAYITEIKDDWAKLAIYNSEAPYNLSGERSELWGVEWVKASDVSTNKADVSIIIKVQLSLSRVRGLSDKESKASQEIIDTEVLALEKLISMYPDAPAALYAREAIEKIKPTETVDPLLEDGDGPDDTGGGTDTLDDEAL